MRVLDLFCGGGGAAEGYVRAGWEVVGVDKKNQPGYPGEFHRGDALEYLRTHGHEYDLVHASPPCQGFSRHVWEQRSDKTKTQNRGRDEPKLIRPVRAWLKSLQLPYVIENLTEARWELQHPITLCGGMFGLIIRRHRLFETWPRLPDPLPEHNCPNLTEIAKRLGIHRQELSIAGNGREGGQRDRWIPLLDIRLNTKMSRYQTKEAIPPAYTHFIAECFKEMGLWS